VRALDIIVIAIVVLSGLLAFARGFVREALSIVSWLGATAAALYAAPYLRPYAERFVPKGTVADSVAAGVAFLVTLIVLTIITSRISRQVKRSSLSALDRTLGLVFGIARGALLVCIGYIALSLVLPPGSDRPRWMAESRTLPLVASAADGLMQLVPPQFRRQAAQFNPQERLDREVESAIRAYSLPVPKSAAGAPPTYAPEDQQRLNQLFQQFGTGSKEHSGQ
jgi:membrane protein required for colicin V production